MKILPSLLATALLLGIGCNQNQDAYRMPKENSEAPPPDPRAKAMWGHNVPAALSKAKKNGTYVLLDFTGSDWCPPCMALHDFVLTQPEFLDYAEKNLELVELDFPQKKSIDEKLAETNKKLAEKYNVEGFPTIIVMDATGKILHRDVGYSGKNAKAYTANLKKVLAQ
tara:strand:+ start:2041 stop:2544 length:504 start_codon:yes stop_codon:yes gene_type:complete